MIKKLFAIGFALTGVASYAAETVDVNFSGGMPKDFTLVDGDGCALEEGAYAHLGSTANSWFVDRVGEGYARVALSPTRNADPTVASDNWMILPAVHVASADAVVCWEARSLHMHIAESYKVMVRVSGAEEWVPLYTCEGETSFWSAHTVSLAAFEDNDVEVAFVATTPHGFMLAVDNIVAGTMPQSKFAVKAEMLSPRFYGEHDDVQVRVRITNCGARKNWDRAFLLLDGGEEASPTVIEPIACGESVELTFDLDPELGKKTTFVVCAHDPASGDINLLENCWVYRSYFARTSIIDHGTGTWCNNCPDAQPTITRLQRLYGDQLIVADVHVNDALTNPDYWADYFSSFVYGIPCFVPNHVAGKIVSKIKETDDYSESLIDETLAGISAAYTVRDGRAAVQATVEFASDIDNSAGDYRIGYMVLADHHDAANPSFVQKNMGSNYRSDQYYYMIDYIRPSLMYYDNVVADGHYATKGVEASLPPAIEAHRAYAHTVELPVPDAASVTGYRVAALVFDPYGHVMNAAVAKLVDIGAVEPVIADPAASDDAWYTLQGMRLTSKPAAKGMYIHAGRVIQIH